MVEQKTDYTPVIWVAGIVIVLSLLFSFGNFGTYRYGMMGGYGYNMMSGYGYGILGVICVLLVITALVLFIIWLVRQLTGGKK